MNRQQLTSEQGAVFIHVAVGLIVLLAFGAFVIDYGMLWVGRGQAQHAADAGALAGAVSLGYDGLDDADKAAGAEGSALSTALWHGVWGEKPVAEVTYPYPAACPGDDTGLSCIRVDTFRNSAKGNA